MYDHVMKKYTKYVICWALWAALLLVTANGAEAGSELTDKGYQLEQLVVMSRHGARAPLVGPNSVVYKLNTHKQPDWQTKPGHLTMKGARNETAFGQYFHCYLVDEGFMPEDWLPQAGQVSFYTNSFQRTIATAKYFSSGMLPVANIPIEYKLGIDESDPVFIKPITLDTPELYKLGSEFHEKSIGNYLSDCADMLISFEKAVDFSNTPYAKEKGIEHLNTKDINIIYKGKNKNVPGYTGALHDAYKTTDSLIMQYYEEADDNKADGGTGLTYQDWQKIGAIHTAGQCMICENPALALRNTHLLLNTIEQDLQNDNLKFAFLCGHDTNIIMLTTVLGVADYHLPNTITYKAPIGGKIVLERRRSKDGRLYINPYMIYQSDNQIRQCQVLNLQNPPMRYHLTFKGLAQNSDGLYDYDEFLKLLNDISERYAYYTNN